MPPAPGVDEEEPLAGVDELFEACHNRSISRELSDSPSLSSAAADAPESGFDDDESS